MTGTNKNPSNVLRMWGKKRLKTIINLIKKELN